MKITQGVTLHPQSLFMVKSFINIQIHYPHRIKISNTKIMKISSETKIWVLNVNLGPEIPYDAS